MANEKTIEAVKTALQNEEKSVELYTSAMNTTQNEVVKKTMAFLADWEKQHIAQIKRLMAHLMGEIEIKDIKTECGKDSMCNVKEFFQKNIDEFKAKIKGSENDINVYKTGMEIEKLGHDFYVSAASEADDKEAKQLFNYLALEETVHFKFLEDQYAYVSDPGSWFLDEEKWLLEG